MAYTASQLQSMGYGGYAGWNDLEANNDFVATGGGGKKTTPSYSSGGGSSSSTSSTDPMALAQQMIKLQQEANQPAIQSLQGQIPETQAKYAQTRTQLQSQQPSIEQRYQNLLDQVKGNQQIAENRQTLTTNNELGRRGITGSSGIAQQEITNAVNPITQQYTGMAKDTSLAREDSLKQLQDQIANLTPQETADTRAINNAIAQLQSGAASQGIGQGLNLYSTNLSAQQADQARRDQQAQQAIANQLAQAQLANQTRETDYNVKRPYSSGGNGGGSGDIDILNKIFGGGQQGTEARPTYNSGVGSYSKGGQWYLTNDGWAPVGK